MTFKNRPVIHFSTKAMLSMSENCLYAARISRRSGWKGVNVGSMDTGIGMEILNAVEYALENRITERRVEDIYILHLVYNDIFEALRQCNHQNIHYHTELIAYREFGLTSFDRHAVLGNLHSNVREGINTCLGRQFE